MNRKCGDCQLCCSLVPVPQMNKGANQRCKHQSFAKGCKVHGTPNMPPSCRMWVCRWLVDPRAAELSRPDRSGYVIDIMPDFVIADDKETNQQHKLPVLQVWCDPSRPNAYKDEKLLNYLAFAAERGGYAALIRYGETEGFVLVAPFFTGFDHWHEHRTNTIQLTHSVADVIEFLGLDKKFEKK